MMLIMLLKINKPFYIARPDNHFSLSYFSFLVIQKINFYHLQHDEAGGDVGRNESPLFELITD